MSAGSIRARLLRTVLLLYLVTWIGVSVATYLEATHEVEEVFDATLSQSAAIISEMALEHIRNGKPEHARLPKAVYGHHYERNISFQIWEGGRLLLRSQSAPETRPATRPGFSDVDVEGSPWRVFMLVSEDGRYTVYAGERYMVRDELINEITLDSLYPLPLSLPLMALLIWYGIGRGFAPLRRVAAEVARRTPQSLQSIDTGPVPDEVRPLTESLNALLARLREAFERETRFTADAAHELRTPLARIKVQAQVARRATGDAERRAALDNILLGVDQATHLVEQLLTLARLEPAHYRQAFTRVDLSAVAADCVRQLAARAAEKHLALEVQQDCASAGGCQVNGNAEALQVLLRNLVDNAIRYTPGGGQVWLKLSDAGDAVCVTVTDTGPGIPAEARQRVFDRFHRRVQDGQGSGLGLSIVQTIAKLHAGHLSLSDAPGGGLRVTLHLPVINEEMNSSTSQKKKIE